jgi:hypothetical protein
MKKLQLKHIIKEEIQKVLKEDKNLPYSDEIIKEFIQGLSNTITTANGLIVDGPTSEMDFGSLIDSTRDFIREFESIPWDN